MAELIFGLQLKDGAHKLAQAVHAFLARIQCRSWVTAAATHFAIVAARLSKGGIPIGSMDTMIATHALATEAVLVTNIARRFERIEALSCETG